MGCDGGTIPRRNELVKIKKKPETKDQTSHQIFQWRYCNITQEPLQRPIVACRLGKLYNKSAIIEAIINKESLPSHIKSLKNTVELNLTKNPEFHQGTSDQIEVAPYVCPVTGLEMSGNYRFIAVWSCGCVFAERALREIKVKQCPKCQINIKESDVIILNPGIEEESVMRNRMESRRKKRKKLMKGNGDCKKMKV